MPLIVLWLFGLGVGRGGTAWLLARPLFTERLAPISYSLYLFHQWVGQLYFLATRHEWWSYWRYRKAFFWFSPAPVPVAWWEFGFVLLLTTLFGLLMARLDPHLIARWEHARRTLHALFVGRQSGARQLTTLQLVLHEIEQLTGAAVEADWTLAECGLASVAGPVVIHRLQDAMPGVTISLAELIEVDTVSGLAALLDVRLKELHATGVGTGATTEVQQ